MNSNVEALERAIAVAEALQPDVGYDVLLAAAKRFIRANRLKNPLSGSSVSCCPVCGIINAGAHYCVGGSGHSTGSSWIDSLNKKSSGCVGGLAEVRTNVTEASKTQDKAYPVSVGDGGQGAGFFNPTSW